VSSSYEINQIINSLQSRINKLENAKGRIQNHKRSMEDLSGDIVKYRNTLSNYYGNSDWVGESLDCGKEHLLDANSVITSILGEYWALLQRIQSEIDSSIRSIAFYQAQLEECEE
jgi:hypothetical protein